MFYGWLILAALAAIYFITIGTTFYGFGVVLAPMTEALGWSRAAAGTGFSIMALGTGLSGPLVAAVIRGFGTRATIFCGGFLTAAGAVVIARFPGLAPFYVGAGMLGLGLGMQTVIPGTHLLNHWFSRRRALAIGVFLTAGGVGAFVSAPTINAVIDLTGTWRVPWLIMGGAGLLASVIAALVVRERPEDLGQHPDGAPVAPHEAAVPAAPERVFRTPVDWEIGAAVRTPAFWLIVLGVGVSVLGLHIVNSQSVLHLRDVGIAPALAATALGLQGLISTGGRLGAGLLGDRIDPRYLMAAGLTCELLGLVTLSFATTPMLVYLFALFFGLGWGTAYVASPTLLANIFGRGNYAALFAIQGVVVTSVAALGPVLAGLAADTTGSYRIAFLVYAGLAAVTAMLVATLRNPRPAPAMQGA